MLRKFKIDVDGRVYTVAVEELSSDGYSAPVAASAPIAMSAPVAAPVTPPVAPAPSLPAAAGSHDVVAPLAGIVDSIEVRVGQTVTVGDKVAVIEAMKMKTEVFTKVAGTVQRIAVKAHDPVDTDQAILTIG
jgi:biotin carboxyl carrier protein